MNKLLVFIFLSFTAVTFAQFGVDYSGTEGLYGPQLKSELHSLVRGHTRYPYSSSSTDTWDILKESDKDTTNPNNVILFYTGWKVSGPAEYNGGSGWNREHTWPKSHGFPSEGDTAYTDTHHLRPTDISINSARGNKDFDNGGTRYVDGDGTTDCYTDSDSWEPRDEVKGDAARITFYMAVRYQSSYDLELVDFTGTSGARLGKLSTLLEWHRMDPPDDFERRRNTAVQSFQGNRNPFIDHPEFVDRLYNANGFIIESAEYLSGSKIIITFSEEPEETTAENPANYSLDRGLGQAVAASKGYDGDPKKVVVTSNLLSPNEDYIISVNNVENTGGETIAENSIVYFDTPGVVPVELVTFGYTLSGGKVTLNWETATETNNNGFRVERKTTGDWVAAGFIQGNGTTTETSRYSFTEKAPASGKLLYRLKQVDYDGSYEYSKVLEVTLVPSALSLSQNYPNPFNPSTRIDFSLPQTSNVKLNIYNITGEKVLTAINGKNMEPGEHSVTVDASALSSGIYFYTLETSAGIISRKMTLLK